MTKKRQRTKFKDFQFEKPEVTYQKEYFDRILSDIQTNTKRATEKIEEIEQSIKLGEELLAIDVLELEKDLRSIEAKVTEGVYDEEAKNSSFRLLCYTSGLNYDALTSVLEPTVENIIQFMNEEITEKQKKHKSNITDLKDILLGLETRKIYVTNLAKYAQDPTRTDLDFSIDIPVEFREFIIDQTDNELMRGQYVYEQEVDKYKQFKKSITNARSDLEKLPLIKQKIEESQIIEAEYQLQRIKTTLKEFKEELTLVNNIRSYLGVLIESLPITEKEQNIFEPLGGLV